MLDTLSSPLSTVLRLTHDSLGHLLSPTLSWAVAIVAIVVCVRSLLLFPALRQAQRGATLRALKPQLDALSEQHAKNPRKLLEEQSALRSRHGVGMFAGMLPLLVQSVVFVCLFHALRGLGGPLAAHLWTGGPTAVVAVALMTIAAVATHLTARRNLALADPTMPGAGLMAALTLWAFPVAAFATGFAMPLAVLVYLATTNLWTLAQTQALSAWVTRGSAQEVAGGA